MKIRVAIWFMTFVLILGPNMTLAGYVNQYSDWRDLGKAAKRGYAMGFIDSKIIQEVDSQHQVKINWRNAYAEGLENCTVALKLNSELLVETIDQWYLRNTSFWHLPPSTVLAIELRNICLNHINAEIEILGLKPWVSSSEWQ
jgi:hypothetical protein